MPHFSRDFGCERSLCGRRVTALRIEDMVMQMTDQPVYLAQ
jgi:hypothetical protein